MLLHIFNCTTYRLTVFTHVAVTTSLLLSCFGVAALALSCLWCVQQKLFNLSDIKAGDTSAGDAFPSWGGVDPRVAIYHIPLSTLRL